MYCHLDKMLLRFNIYVNILFVYVASRRYEKCLDNDMNCYSWVADDPKLCETDEIVIKDCKKTCITCKDQVVPDEFNIKLMPPNLKRIAFLVGRWRSEFGGKADFPTIPRFTYGEQIEFRIVNSTKFPVLNYTAFAWDNSDLTELHSENGYVTGDANSSYVALNTASLPSKKAKRKISVYDFT